MTALLTDNLPLLAGAPSGIQKLRELILELAVRGKLVPQDTSDEPASELLKRIAEEKARLVAEGKIKKQKPPAESTEVEKPFGLPEGWSWTSLNEIAAMRGGSTPSMSKPEFWDGDIPWVSPKDMHDGDITDSELKITQLALDKTSLELVPIGSILLVGRSGILKRKLPAQITAVPCTINQDLKAISPFQPQPSNYVQLMLRGTERVILREDVKQGTTVQSLVYEKLFVRPFGLPPLAEQHRIVAKVDELMALCDRLEARQADADSAHAQLVQALLGSLTQASDAADFAQSWQRLAEHFHTLFTTESSIDALKQTLLQLAVMGKLVPQDPNDEPASELLKRIADAKEQAASQGRVRKVKTATDYRASDTEVTVPAGWSLSTVGEVTICRDGERIPVSQAEREGRAKTYDYYGASGVIDKIDGYLFDKPLLLVGEDGANLINRSTPIAFMARGKYWVNNHAHVLDGVSEALLLYVQLYFNAIDLKPYVTGTAQPKMNQAKMNSIVLLLPPEAEQHRIVAKVDQLMALCDQLKARLNQARQVHEHLASALVEQAVA